MVEPGARRLQHLPGRVDDRQAAASHDAADTGDPYACPCGGTLDRSAGGRRRGEAEFIVVTTAEQRREKIRTAILEQHRALTIAGKREGKPCETWKALFERSYRTSLNKPET